MNRDLKTWALEQLGDPEAVILDTETTGLEGGLIVQIGILSVTGEVLLESLLNPGVSIPAGATRIHGITDEMVKDAPTFKELLPRIEAAIRGKRVLIYNAQYDMGILRNELARCGIGREWGSIAAGWKDVMMPYSEWVGDVWPDWSRLSGQVRWQKLPAGDHSAIGDCRATVGVLKRMAEV